MPQASGIWLSFLLQTAIWKPSDDCLEAPDGYQMVQKSDDAKKRLSDGLVGTLVGIPVPKGRQSGEVVSCESVWRPSDAPDGLTTVWFQQTV